MKKTMLIGLLIIIHFIVGCSEEDFTEDTETFDTEEPEGGQEVLMEGEEWFQTGNTDYVIRFQTKTSEELEDNKIGEMLTLHPGIHNEDPNDMANRFNEEGLKWLRVSIDTFDWNEVPDVGAYSEHYVYLYIFRFI